MKITVTAADISKPENVQKILDNILAKWGTVQIACNNAGISMNSLSEATTLEEWDKTFKAAGRIMLNQGYGKIINTASMASLIGEIVDTPFIHFEDLKPFVQCWLTDILAGRQAQVTDLQAAAVTRHLKLQII